MRFARRCLCCEVYLVGTDLTETAAREMGMDDYHPLVIDRLKRAYQVGVSVAFGTDVCFVKEGDTRGTLSIAFIDSFVEAGVAPRSILSS